MALFSMKLKETPTQNDLNNKKYLRLTSLKVEKPVRCKAWFSHNSGSIYLRFSPFFLPDGGQQRLGYRVFLPNLQKKETHL